MERVRDAAVRHVRGAALGRVACGLAVLVASGTAPAWAASEGGGGLIALNASLLVQIVNFLILLAVLYRFLFRPVSGMLTERSEAIRRQLAEAQAAREEAQRQLAEFDARLRAAQAEAQAVRERALREAAEVRERLTTEARQEATRLLEVAQAQIQQEVRRARAELRAEVGALAVDIAERLVKKSLREEDHHRLIQDALARMEA